LLKDERERQTPRKQRHTAAWIKILQRKKRCYTGSSASVRPAVRRVRQAMANPLVRATVLSSTPATIRRERASRWRQNWT